MTNTTNGHYVDIAGSSHAFNQRGPAEAAYQLGWNHARAQLIAQFLTTIENAQRMARTGPEPNFHNGLAEGLQAAISAVAPEEATDPTPKPAEICIVGLEDGEDFSGIVACSTKELALQWVRFLNTLPLVNDARPVVGGVRLDAPVPALARTEQIFAAVVTLGALPERPIDQVIINEIDGVWHPDSLWFSIKEQGETMLYVNGIFATDKADAQRQATEAVQHWLANRAGAQRNTPASEEASR